MTKAPHSRKQKRLQRELNLGRLDSIGLGRWSGGQRVAMTLPGLTLGIAPLVGVGAGVLIGAIGVGGIILVSCCTFAVLVFGGAVVFDVLSTRSTSRSPSLWSCRSWTSRPPSPRACLRTVAWLSTWRVVSPLSLGAVG